MEEKTKINNEEDNDNVNKQIIQVFEELEISIEDIAFTVGEYRKC